jgi:hypothetical protein
VVDAGREVLLTEANVLESKTGADVVGDFVSGAIVVEKGRLYFADGREVLWFDKSIQSTGFLILVLVFFWLVVPTSKILNNNYILLNMFASHCTVQY